MSETQAVTWGREPLVEGVRRRLALFGELAALGAQVWMTGADPALFGELDGRADMVKVADGRIASN